jgi:hypothetical protein
MLSFAQLNNIKGARSCRALYFGFTINKEVLYSLKVGMSEDCVEVVGDPDNGCYEWIIRTLEGVLEHSDCGYGMPSVALRDGLIAYYGLPEDPIEVAPRW